MPVLTFKKNPLLNLSYTYNSLTIYPKFFGPIRRVFPCRELASTQIPQPLVAKYVQHDSKMFSDLRRQVTSVSGFARMAYAGDFDHHLFHKESAQDKDFDPNNDHYHFVFKTYLDQTKITEILDIFIKYQYVCEEEKQEFLTNLKDRYAKEFAQLRAILNGDKDTVVEGAILNGDKDTVVEGILKFISACEDNDVLVNIRTFLMTQEFDYLRHPKDDNPGQWKTLDTNNQPVESSAIWSQVEDAIASQIHKNDVSNFKQNGRVHEQLLANRNALYTNSHPFIFFNRHPMQPQSEAQRNFKSQSPSLQ